MRPYVLAQPPCLSYRDFEPPATNDPPVSVLNKYGGRHQGAEIDEERIRERAYRLWQQDGAPDGRADEYWEKARSQVLAESSSTTVSNALWGSSTAGNGEK